MIDKKTKEALRRNKKLKRNEFAYDYDAEVNRHRDYRNNSGANLDGRISSSKKEIYRILSDAEDERRREHFPAASYLIQEAVDLARVLVFNEDGHLDERELAEEGPKIFGMIYSRAKRFDKQVAETKKKRIGGQAVDVQFMLTQPITNYVESQIRKAGYGIQEGVPVASRGAGITSIILGILGFGILNNSTLTGNVVGISQKNISGIGIIVGVLLVIAGILFLQKRTKIKKIK